MQFGAWQNSQVSSSGPEDDEAGLQTGDLEKILCIAEMICRDFYCFPDGSWRFGGLNYASSIVATYSSNVQPHLLLFATSQGVFVLLWVGWSTGGRVSLATALRHTQCLVLWYFSFLFVCGGGMGVISCKVER